MRHVWRSVPWTSAIATGASVALLAMVLGTPGGTAQQRTLRFEVAENGPRFVSDQQQYLTESGQPTRGNQFLSEGWIYPEGTLTCDGVRCNGVLIDGDGIAAPEFPDRVLGRWTIHGVHVADQPVASGPVFITTQIFDLGTTVGADMIVTHGFDIADLGVNVDRAITGGTGDYALAAGVQHQRYIGLNNLGLMQDDVPLFGGTFATELDLAPPR